jgi:Spy/CpxP family protein refolding chaperone
MRKFTWLVLAAVLAVVAVPLAAGQKAGAAGGHKGKSAAPAKGSKEAVDAEVAQMISECKLTAEQQEALKEKAKAKVEALEAWNKENAEKIKAAEEAAKTARSSGTGAARGKGPSELKTLEDSRDAATAQADAAMLAVLTPEQQAAWKGYKLFETVSAKYRKANPTEEELAKIKSLCAAAAQQMGEPNSGDKKAKKGSADVEGKLRWAIEEAVLTPEQRATVVRKPAAGKRGAAQPAATQPAAEPAAQPEAPKPESENK